MNASAFGIQGGLKSDKKGRWSRRRERIAESIQLKRSQMLIFIIETISPINSNHLNAIELLHHNYTTMVFIGNEFWFIHIYINRVYVVGFHTTPLFLFG